MFRHAIAVAVAVLAAVPLSAQSADVSVALRLLNQPLINASAEYALDVTNRGPDRATRVAVVWTMPSPQYSYDNRCRQNGLDVLCSIDLLDAGESVTFRAGVKLAHRSSLTTTALAHGTEADPEPANNTATLTHVVIDPSKDLHVSITAPDRLDEQNRGVYHVGIGSTSAFDAPDATLTFTLSIGVRIVDASPPLRCADVEGHPVCSAGPLASGESRDYAVTVEHPTREGHYFTVVGLDWSASRTGATGTSVSATFYRRFAVSSVADGGSGSVREAVLGVNDQCARDRVPCLIEFQGAITIEPGSRLPMIVAPEIVIDGGGSTIRGDAVPDGDGLFIAADRITLRNLQVTGFGQNGLLLVPLNPNGFPHALTISACTATGNGLRGVMTYGLGGSIEGSDVSDNRRSGLFVASGSGFTIRSNHFERNGASGVYLPPSLNDGAILENNLIADNADFGVAINRSPRVQVLANSIYGNGQSIDIALDGPSEENVPPEILDAQFDSATGDTVIRGVGGKTSETSRYSVLLYASRNVDRDGLGQGEAYLGTVDTGRDGTFMFRYPGELKGRFVSGVTLFTLDFGDFVSHQTSEFGRPAKVN
jgi:parallel beta helix pectate lyase-like protein/uncharacterized protein DUF11